MTKNNYKETYTNLISTIWQTKNKVINLTTAIYIKNENSLCGILEVLSLSFDVATANVTNIRTLNDY